MEKTPTRPWDPAEHLETEEDMAAYLSAALEEGDLGSDHGDLGGYRPGPENGVGGPGDGSGKGEPLQVSVRQRQSRVRHRSEGGACSGAAASGHRRA